MFVADAVFDLRRPPEGSCVIRGYEGTTVREVDRTLAAEDLLVPVFREGRVTYEAPALDEVQARVRAQLECLPAGTRRLDDPEPYPTGLEGSLYDLRARLLEAHATGS
jgi:nicotinate phosphoribosyltransferase